DVAPPLTNLDDGDVLFIDEVHRLSRTVEEVLYPAMEDFQLDIVIGKGPSARSIRLDLPRFTLVGATTRTGRITGPLRDRFGFVARVDYYAPADLRAILDTVCRRFSGGPVGLSTLAISVGEEEETVEYVYEPFLLQLGLLKRTPKGRVATPAAFAHVGVPVPERSAGLFD